MIYLQKWLRIYRHLTSKVQHRRAMYQIEGTNEPESLQCRIDSPRDSWISTRTRQEAGQNQLYLRPRNWCKWSQGSPSSPAEPSQRHRKVFDQWGLPYRTERNNLSCRLRTWPRSRKSSSSTRSYRRSAPQRSRMMRKTGPRSIRDGYLGSKQSFFSYMQ